MGIKHTFVSSKSDGADATLVQPSNWNDEHTIDSEIAIPTVASPATPGSGVNVYTQALGGRSMLAVLAPAGRARPLQPHCGFSRIASWLSNGSTGFDTNGMRGPGVTGTGTARTPTSTNLATSVIRTGIVSAATAGSIAAVSASSTLKDFWRGNASGLGGFHAVFRFCVSDASLVSTANMFVGMAANLPADGATSGRTNAIGVGCDSGDTTLQLYGAGSSAQARVDLGASFPVDTTSTDVYELVLYAAPNGSEVTYQVTRLNTGDTTSGTISASANLPGNTAFLTPQCYRSNGGTASAVAIDVLGVVIETEI
jgi:hypothetical protein